jgi:hypothetical protein
MSLDLAHAELAWPPSDQVINPPGAGPRVIAETTRKKIGQNLARVTGRNDIRVGVLLDDPTSDTTQPPMAIVCEFLRRPDFTELVEAQRLCWNYSTAPVLFTVEPGLIRSWTCCEPPPTEDQKKPSSPELTEATYRLGEPDDSTARAASSLLHWLNLVHGRLFREQPKRFNRDKCGDQLLLSNLRQLRRLLVDEQELDIDISHDLLARLIFIQFLFDRKDSQGRAALNSDLLSRLRADQVLQHPSTNLSEILSNRTDAYRFFGWLNERFNGDLFPSPRADAGKDSELSKEMKAVRREHLDTLSDFVAGRLEFQTGQRSLWPQYSFDSIRLEFISSIYETFVTKSRKENKKAIYTPPHVVDFLLDSVLPWNSAEWDLRILDPACGSGVFLVKAFQRLIHRWKLANPGEDPKAELLRRILERNLVGIDVEERAVRTAVFSLYLALCDEIDPKYYWQQIRFPPLRHKTLVSEDFFKISEPSVSAESAGSFDLVVGNAPWGKNSLTPAALEWSVKRDWPVHYKDIGPLFLAKSSEHAIMTGRISFLQPSALLFGTGTNIEAFRRRLFSDYDVLEVANLSALRFGLFVDAVAPACIVTYSPGKPTSDIIQYVCPKPTKTAEDNYRIRIEPGDVHTVFREEAINETLVWSVLRWGNRRDLSLIRRLTKFTNLAQHESAEVVHTRNGIIRGDRKKKLKTLVGRPILESEAFPSDIFLVLDGASLPINSDPWIDGKGSTDLRAFELPQLIIKKGFQQSVRRFRAVRVQNKSALCSDSYITVQGPAEILDTAIATYNSSLAIYFLFLTSSRLGTYRPAVLQHELLGVPLPDRPVKLSSRIRTFEQLDALVRSSIDLKESEWALIEDRVHYTLSDFFAGPESPGRLSTSRNETATELRLFAEYVIRVLGAAFGERFQSSATLFAESDGQTPLAVRMLAIHLAHTQEQGIRTIRVSPGQLYERLREFEIRSKQEDAAGLSFVPKAVRLYDFVDRDGARVPTVFLIRPDEVRFWTRAEALQEGDEIARDLLTWSDVFREPRVEVPNS